MLDGSLTIVGTGIRLSQLSVEARSAIESAGKLFFLVADPVTRAWITQINSQAESLEGFYTPGKVRRLIYLEMVDRIMSSVREGLKVCAIFYGHPGVFADPAHESVRRARAEGFPATMLPGISAEDCLFADLGIDPARNGCQSYEATDFLISRRRFDPRTPLILWQIALTGQLVFKPEYSNDGLRVLVQVLLESHRPDHEVAIYEAASVLGCEPRIERVPLAKLPEAKVTPISTLYVPPAALANPNLEMAERLGVSRSDIAHRWTSFNEAS